MDCWTEHANERTRERCRSAGVDPSYVQSRAEKAVARCKPTRTYAVRLLALPRAVGVAMSAQSNGDELWAIIRGGVLQTIMLRRSNQAVTPGAFGVHEVRRNG